MLELGLSDYQKMSSGTVDKIRNILNDPREEDLCLSDIVNEALALDLLCAKLEIENNKTALRDLKRAIRNFKKTVIKFEYRIGTVIGNEIIAYDSNHKGENYHSGRGLSNSKEDVKINK